MSIDPDKKSTFGHFERADLPEVEADLPYKRNKQLDEAAEILRQAGPIDVSAEDDGRVLRMIDWHVCLPMCIVYLCQQVGGRPCLFFFFFLSLVIWLPRHLTIFPSATKMDKGAVSSAAVFNLQKETHLHGTQYSWLSSSLYLAELCWQPVSSFALIFFPGE